MSLRPSLRRGYTVIEVMVSMTILAVGAVGIIGIQKVTAVGNTSARNVAVASVLANSWAERLHTDSIRWVDAQSLSSTRWLQFADGPPVTNLEVSPFGSERADVLGADIFAGDGNTIAFCTEITLVTIYPNLISATIHVFWNRNGSPVDCTQAPLPSYGTHTVVTALRQNVVQAQ